MKKERMFHSFRICLSLAAALAIIAPLTAGAANRIWVGPTNGDWFTTINWAPGDNWPQAGDTVSVTNGSVLLTNSTAYLGTFTITNASLTFTNWNSALQAVTVNVQSGAVMRHPPQNATTTNGSGGWDADSRVYILCTNLTIDAGGTIDVTGRGYAGGGRYTNGFGPGGGYGNTQCGLGGGYGGLGGNGGNGALRTQALVYGSAALPTDPGSGGGGGDANGGASGNGGGAVWLVAASNATVNGSIIADGTGPNPASYQGGGSGGGVYLKAQKLLGTGSITARGGSGTANYSSGGGGGRIGLDLGDAANWTGKIDVAGGWTSFIYSSLLPAQVGTVYATNNSFMRETFTNQQWRLFGVNAWSPNQLMVSSNAYLSFEEPTFNLVVGSNMTIAGGSYLGMGAGVLTNSASLSVTGNLSVLGSSTLSLGTTNMPLASQLTVGGNMMLSNGASLNVYSAATNNLNTNYFGALVSVGGTLLLASNSWIYPASQGTNGGSPTFRMQDLTILTNAGFNANARGYIGGTTEGYGPGRGRKVGSMASGASYGGMGGTGIWTTVQSNPTNTYGSMNAPSDPGSGGAWYNTGVGCSGGGLVRIEARGDVTLNGVITASGGTSPGGDYKSGGAGGGIYIACRFLKGAQGTLSATGGSASVFTSTAMSGAGGGGRIAVWSLLSQATTGTWTITASGGSAPTNTSAGLPGTVVFGRSPSPPMLTNSPATALTVNSATLNGTLLSTGTAPTYVWVYWGPVDQTTNKNLWANTNAFPGVQSAEGVTLSTNLTGLDSGVAYYYRYYATNSQGEAWASPSQLFSTIAGVPVISNAASGATSITPTSAVLNGYLASTGTAQTTLSVFWGPTDGGTNGTWANTNSFTGYQSVGNWSTNVTLPSSNTYYYYTFYATNSSGGVWASPSVSFIAAGVSLTATVPNAIEKGTNNTGLFTVQRLVAVTNLPLTVNYRISGTASNGIDYNFLPGTVIIPAGATTNTITITPIMDGVYDIPDKQVTLTLAPGAYASGIPSNGAVTIQDVAPAATNTWTGIGNWTNTANWSDAIPGLPGQAVTIQGTATLSTATAALGPVTILSNSTLIFSGTNAVLNATDVTINGLVTHVANSAVTTNQFGQWIADGRVYILCTNLTVSSIGSINVLGKGYGGGGNHTNGFGPGGGLFFSAGQGAGGGGYGGRGGLWQSSLGTQAVTYGSTALPVDPGSGGGGDTGFAGGGGGGAVLLAIAANATVNGQIIADGAAGGNGSGGGSGGGVFLSAQTVQGTGSITAKGGNGSASYGSGGGGGRLALYAGNASGWVGKIDVSLGTTAVNATPLLAQLGTVYASSTSLLRETFTNQQWRLFGVTTWSPGQLTVSNAYLSFEETTLALSVSSNLTIAGGSYFGLGAGVLTNAASLSVTGNLSVQGSSTMSLGTTNMPQAALLTVGGDMTLSNGASLAVYSAATNNINTNYYGSLVSIGGTLLLTSNSWVYPYSHSTNGGSPTFRMRDLTILTNAGFNANSAGYAGGLNSGFGPGFGSKGSDTFSGGASYGGLGGRGYAPVTYMGAVGPTNGSVQTPSGPGSGAGGYSTVAGGAGGGLVRIESTGKVTLNGTITANGQNGTSIPSAGGSGGAIYIQCVALAGDTAILSANGGSYGDYGSPVDLAGAGGGGRIAIWRERGPDNTNTWTITVTGGAGKIGYSPVSGADGTLFWGNIPLRGTVLIIQ